MKELKVELSRLNLSTSGNKNDLQDRLTEHVRTEGKDPEVIEFEISVEKDQEVTSMDQLTALFSKFQSSFENKMEIAASRSDAYQEENRNMILDMRSSLESNLEQAKLEMREEIGTVRSEFQHGVSNVQSEVDDIRESLIKTNNEIQVLKETLNNPSSPPVTNNTRNLPLIVESSSRAFRNYPSISPPLISSPAVHKMRSPEFDGCNRTGHLQKDCRQRKSRLECWNCRDKGHTQSDCPKRRRSGDLARDPDQKKFRTESPKQEN
ncbi:hypothetical protein M8J75_010610 [Diaphorina citri]|nr:hypothetical protein M8J75_010610 [Diaphorina citri]